MRHGSRAVVTKIRELFDDREPLLESHSVGCMVDTKVPDESLKILNNEATRTLVFKRSASCSRSMQKLTKQRELNPIILHHHTCHPLPAVSDHRTGSSFRPRKLAERQTGSEEMSITIAFCRLALSKLAGTVQIITRPPIVATRTRGRGQPRAKQTCFPRPKF
jgi:hypothetical protein